MLRNKEPWNLYYDRKRDSKAKQIVKKVRRLWKKVKRKTFSFFSKINEKRIYFYKCLLNILYRLSRKNKKKIKVKYNHLNFFRLFVISMFSRKIYIIDSFFMNLLVFFYSNNFIFFKDKKLFLYNYKIAYKNYKRLRVKEKILKSFRYFFSLFNMFILSAITTFILFYLFLVIKIVPFVKLLLGWFSVFMLFYWLLSGFVFFIKKYRFGKFTAAIQRFWRRSYILFWILETIVFLIFLYLLFNSSTESAYMYDTPQIFKSHLLSWKFFIFKIPPFVLVIMLAYNLILMVRWGFFEKVNKIIFFISILLFYILWLELYQIYHILSFYKGYVWIFDLDERIWLLDSNMQRTRIINHYVTICYIAKFWHLLFIIFFWFFFIFRTKELNRIRYPILSANYQNLIILYILSWICMYPWIKYILGRYLTYNYFWFFFNNRNDKLTNFFNEVKLISFNFFKKFDLNESYSYYFFKILIFNKPKFTNSPDKFIFLKKNKKINWELNNGFFFHYKRHEIIQKKIFWEKNNFLYNIKKNNFFFLDKSLSLLDFFIFYPIKIVEAFLLQLFWLINNIYLFFPFSNPYKDSFYINYATMLAFKIKLKIFMLHIIFFFCSNFKIFF